MAHQLATDRTSAVWPMKAGDVQLARDLAPRYPALSARDLVHVARCTRRSVQRVHTYDRALAAAFGG